MKKIATITFHASYNFGSNLQAYALQEYVKKICDEKCEYKIINLRTKLQKELYKIPFEKKGIKNRIKCLLYINKKKDFILKAERFEKFINEKLQLTEEYSSFDALKKADLKFDYYLAGSDQLWNLSATDFDWSNYLEFINSKNKISYAASFGPKAQNWSYDEKERVKKNLSEFKYLSVREIGSFNNVKELTGIESDINIDPTMLIEECDWNKIIDKEPIIQGDYIYLYEVHGKKESFEIAKKVSKILGMPVVVAKENAWMHIFCDFIKEYSCGPEEFLNILKNSKLVLSSSFHGTVFSILFKKPFLAINGAKDFRISNLLKKMDLEDRVIECENIEKKCNSVFNINFDKAEELLKEEREKSKKYLVKALDV